MEERERRFAAFDASIAQGLADIEAGRVEAADSVFEALEAELTALPDVPPT